MNVRTIFGFISILAFPSQPMSLGVPAVNRLQMAPVAAQLEGGTRWE
jgi:hypothetical protein